MLVMVKGLVVMSASWNDAVHAASEAIIRNK